MIFEVGGALCDPPLVFSLVGTDNLNDSQVEPVRVAMFIHERLAGSTALTASTMTSAPTRKDVSATASAAT